ncbi:MAG: TraB/GumN family protein, partial [Verrucomicrobiales bacterium]
MRRLLTGWIGAMAVFGLCFGQEKVAPEGPLEHPLKPLLWKVEGEEIQGTVWLFGTIHLGKGPLATLHPAAEVALTGADVVCTEVPLDMATQLGLAKHFIRDDGKKLGDSIGAELSTQLDAELKAINPMLNAIPFQSFKTWAVAVTLPMLEMQMTGEKALDMIIWEKGAAAGKTMGALEKPADQFSIFDGLKEEEQIVLLSEGLRMQKEARVEGKNPIGDLVEAYLSGEVERVEDEMVRNFAEMIGR